MADVYGSEVPQTLEGWYLLHDIYSLDWARWWALEGSLRARIAAEARQWLMDASRCEKGDSAAYSILTQKGDIMFLHCRETPAELNRLELSLHRTRLDEFLRPAYSFLSVIEIGFYELTSFARQKLTDQGIIPGSLGYDVAFETEMEKQKQHIQDRLFRNIPENRYICFYPMNKRRGERVNWYALSIAERRDMMRSHGQVSQKYYKQVVQVISGAIGLDDWEWGVSMYADDLLLFKKMMYELRFDLAGALYTEFGPFYTGIRIEPEQLPDLLDGQLL